MNPSLFPEPDVTNAEPIKTPTISLGPQSRDLVEINPKLVATKDQPDDLEWWEDNKNCVIAQEQLLTAVYLAARDDICIRQQVRDIEQDDACIFVRPEHVPALIRKLQELIR
jgi:hypothetical protein